MGRVRIILVAVLVVALLGALGLGFWQKQQSTEENRRAAEDSKAKQTAKTTTPKEELKEEETASKESAYKTFTTDTHPISFTYPGTWKVEKLQSNEQYALSRSVTVTTDQGNKLSFSIGGQGLGGTCGAVSPTRRTIEVTPTTLKTEKPTALSFTLTQRPDGSYIATYGLTDTYTTVGETNVCDNMFNYAFDSGAQAYLLMGFRGTKTFASLDEAKSFVSSSEYAAIKKTMLTLTYS